MVFITVAVYSAKDQRLALRFTGLHGTLFAWRKPEAMGPPAALMRSRGTSGMPATKFSSFEAFCDAFRFASMRAMVLSHGNFSESKSILRGWTTYAVAIEVITANQEVKKGTRS
jgi:hypothetical protein